MGRSLNNPTVNKEVFLPKFGKSPDENIPGKNGVIDRNSPQSVTAPPRPVRLGVK